MNPYELNDQNLQRWLDMLADGELAPLQRQQLVQFLEASAAHWRSCALTLLNERTLMRVVPRVCPRDMGKGELPTSRTGRRWPTAGLLLAASVLVLAGFFAHGLWKQSTDRRELARASDNQVPQLVFPNRFGGGIFPTVGQTSPVTFFEIEDGPTRATYYVDQRIPKFFLEAFVRAGHDVIVSQESVGLAASENERYEIPIYAVRIEKQPKPNL